MPPEPPKDQQSSETIYSLALSNLGSPAEATQIIHVTHNDVLPLRAKQRGFNAVWEIKKKTEDNNINHKGTALSL